MSEGACRLNLFIYLQKIVRFFLPKHFIDSVPKYRTLRLKDLTRKLHICLVNSYKGLCNENFSIILKHGNKFESKQVEGNWWGAKPTKKILPPIPSLRKV